MRLKRYAQMDRSAAPAPKQSLLTVILMPLGALFIAAMFYFDWFRGEPWWPFVKWSLSFFIALYISEMAVSYAGWRKKRTEG